MMSEKKGAIPSAVVENGVSHSRIHPAPAGAEQAVNKWHGWISVKDRKPDNSRAVLVALEGLTIGGAPAMAIGSYTRGFWMVADADGTHYLTKYMRFEVTHWMPLPEPPKGDLT